jgi:ZIP family zinc transporter
MGGGKEILTQAINGILIPFWGTALGAACVFFVRRKTENGVHTAIEGFSSGVMVAASVWSLIIPSMELSENRGKNPAIPVVFGFTLGILFFLLFDRLLSYRSQALKERSGKEIPKVFLTCFAIALHNLPEGMAVGAVFAEVLSDSSATHISAAMALSIGIAVQNFPEGAIVSMPLHSNGTKKSKAFMLGALSGIIEPIGAFLTVLAAGFAVPLLPYLLGFAAGAMIYAVIDGFSSGLGESDFKNKAMTILSFSLGFLTMMSLDVILG